MKAFVGDQEILLDKLIAASQRREVPVSSLQERTLVPFFDCADPSASTFQSLQPGRRSAPSKPVVVPSHHGLKRGAHERSNAHLVGSPPKKENEVVQAQHQRRGGKHAAAAPGASHSSPTSSGGASRAGSVSDGEATSARKPRSGGGGKPPLAASPRPAAVPVPAGAQAHGKKHQRERTAAPVASSVIVAQRQSPPRRRPEPASVMHQLVAASSAAAGAPLRTPGSKGGKPSVPTKFAGPAFTNSPTPDCLPLPTSSLLLAEAADGLRARLTL